MRLGMVLYLVLILGGGSFGELPWWNHSIFYEIYLRSFQDSDGNGHGDIKGLISRLDYLNDGNPETNQDLGITGIWLMPVFEAQSQHGYDTLDYLSIEKDYGSLEDFQTLVRECHRRGIKIVLDLVLNHTSHNHPWFLESSSSVESSKRSWYIWSDRKENTYFRPVGTSSTGPWFFGLFNETMPDLNYRNPEVSGKMLEITRYWLEKTPIDGYRLDAVKHLVETGNQVQNTPETHRWLQEFHRVYKGVNPQGFTVGEVWDDLRTIRSYTGKEMDVNFNFPLSTALAESVKSASWGPLSKVLKETLELFPDQQWASFIRNHDMPRLMKDLQGDKSKALQAAGVLLTLPGVPFIYYGEEIGLSRNRAAMQWDSQAPAWGFTSGRVFANGAQEKDPRFTVSAQTNDPASLLWSYRNLISLRNSNGPLKTGEMTIVETGNPRIGAWIRRLGETGILVIHNFSDRTEQVVGFQNLGSWGIKPGTIKGLYGKISALQGSLKTSINMEPRSGVMVDLERL